MKISTKLFVLLVLYFKTSRCYYSEFVLYFIFLNEELSKISIKFFIYLHKNFFACAANQDLTYFQNFKYQWKTKLWDIFWDRLHISLQIISEFKGISQLLFSLKSSENHSFSADFKGEFTLILLKTKFGDDALCKSKAMSMKLLSQVLAKIRWISGNLHFTFTAFWKYEAVKLNTLGDDTFSGQKIINKSKAPRPKNILIKTQDYNFLTYFFCYWLSLNWFSQNLLENTFLYEFTQYARANPFY